MGERLTQRQNEIYEFLRTQIREHNRPPSIKEIGDAMGISSTNGVSKHLDTLEKKGWITRTHHEARSIELVDDEEKNLFASDGGEPKLPVISRASSLEPELLRAQPRGYLALDRRLLQGAREPEESLIGIACDDGMNGDGIRKGDLLVIDELPWEQMSNGDLAAFIVEDRVLARHYHYANKHIHLRPADRHYTEEKFATNDPRCHVIGPIVCVLRMTF